MEFREKEVQAVTEAVVQGEVVQELNDLQLTLVGGGSGETSL